MSQGQSPTNANLVANKLYAHTFTGTEAYSVRGKKGAPASQEIDEEKLRGKRVKI